MTNPIDDNGVTSRKRFRYFLLAYVCLFFGALFSGADGSFFGIGFAAALFFLFMALMNLSRRKVQFTRGSSAHFASQSSSRPGPPSPVSTPNPPHARAYSSGDNFLEELKKVLRQARTKYDAASNETKGRIISVVFISAMIVFFVVVFSSVDSDDSISEGDFVIEQAGLYYNRGEYDSAMMYYRMGLALDSDLASAFQGMGNVKLVQKEYDSSLLYYNKALALDPDDEGSLNGKGLCYFYTQQYNAAIAECKRVLALNASNEDALALTGDCFYNQELYDSALIYYEPRYELGNRSRLLCHIMAFIYDKKGQFEKAVPLYEEALTYDTTIVDIYQRLSEIAPAEKANYYRQKMQQLPR
jgi:tetratricopeptide (TPR) repeat protein